MRFLTENYFDTLVAGFVLLSALVGYVHGLIKEVFKILSWLGSFLITYHLLPTLASILPIASILMSYLVGGVFLFLTFLVVISLVFKLIHSLLEMADSLGSTDRIMGMSFGAMRGIFVFCLAYSLYSMTPSATEPAFVQKAKLRPLIIYGSSLVNSLIGMPERLRFSASLKTPLHTPWTIPLAIPLEIPLGASRKAPLEAPLEAPIPPSANPLAVDKAGGDHLAG